RASGSYLNAATSPHCSAATRTGAACSPSPIAESARQAREVHRGDAVEHGAANRPRILKRDADDLERSAGDSELNVGVAAPPSQRPLHDLDRLQLHTRGDVEAGREPAAADVDMTLVHGMAIMTPEEMLAHREKRSQPD